MYLQVIAFCTIISCCANCAPTAIDSLTPTHTTIKTRNATRDSIEHKVLKKPHHLFIGRCKPEDKILHQENIILHNDGKSHVAAGIKMKVEAQVNITCVKIYDEVPDGAGGYPEYVAGGMGDDYVEFNVNSTDYGKGFHFFVQIFGNEIKHES